jgi:nitrilase
MNQVAKGAGRGGRVTVAAVQAEVVPGLEAALDRTAALAGEAARLGASLVAFPETWIPGYPAWLDVCRDAALWDHPPVKAVFGRMAAESVVVDGDSGKRLRTIARDAGVTLVVGVTERVESGPGRGTLYNALLTIGPDGALLNHHRKLVPTYTERLVWGPGDAAGLHAVDVPGCRVGGLVCWEHWMPLARQALHQSGEDVHVALWPTVHERHQIASRHYAFEGRCHVLAVGALMRASALPPELEPHPDRVPGADSWILRGGSAIIGPDGNYLVEPVWEREQLLVAELELGRGREEAMTLDVTGHYHRPELLTLSVHRAERRTMDGGSAAGTMDGGSMDGGTGAAGTMDGGGSGA